jgi:hypothetical protein
VCGTNEEYNSCGSCVETCDNDGKLCAKNCNRGCFCKTGYVRQSTGTSPCIKREACQKKDDILACGRCINTVTERTADGVQLAYLEYDVRYLRLDYNNIVYDNTCGCFVCRNNNGYLLYDNACLNGRGCLRCGK